MSAPNLTEHQRMAVLELTAAERALLRRLAQHPMTSERVRDPNDWERLAYLVHFEFAKTTYSARTGLQWEITRPGLVVLHTKRADLAQAVAS